MIPEYLDENDILVKEINSLKNKVSKLELKIDDLQIKLYKTVDALELLIRNNKLKIDIEMLNKSKNNKK